MSIKNFLKFYANANSIVTLTGLFADVSILLFLLFTRRLKRVQRLEEEEEEEEEGEGKGRMEKRMRRGWKQRRNIKLQRAGQCLGDGKTNGEQLCKSYLNWNYSMVPISKIAFTVFYEPQKKKKKMKTLLRRNSDDKRVNKKNK